MTKLLRYAVILKLGRMIRYSENISCRNIRMRGIGVELSPGSARRLPLNNRFRAPVAVGALQSETDPTLAPERGQLELG